MCAFMERRCVRKSSHVVQADPAGTTCIGQTDLGGAGEVTGAGVGARHDVRLLDSDPAAVELPAGRCVDRKLYL